MRIAFYTLGCKVNQYETQILKNTFSANGFDVVEPTDRADVYVVNSCTVTAAGDQKTRKILRKFKRENPASVTALTGCFPQAFPDVAEKIPEADVITGSYNRKNLLHAVTQAVNTGERVVEIAPHKKGEDFEEMKVTGFDHRTRAFVKIQDGCDRYCSYCIIPTARGFVRSKPLEQLEDELDALAKNGYQEVVLVGINLSSYGKDTGLRLIDAVDAACKRIPRVRLGSLEPELLTKEDISQMASYESFCPQFHLSLQSGCDATLKRMNRHYDRAEYRRIVQDIRTAFPNASITTDIMVGFPGETDEEFRQSVEFVEEIGFGKVHVFVYSIREGTRAATMTNQIPKQVKEERSKQMQAAVEASRQAFLAKQAGRKEAVLFETRTGGKLHGYTPNYTTVIIDTEEDFCGIIKEVFLTEARNGFCTGEIL